MPFQNSRLFTMIVATVGLACVSSRAAADAASSIDAAPRPAKIVEVIAAGAAAAASFPGVLQAAEQADLTFSVSGRVVELPVTVGAAVKPGELIARIEEPRFEARLASAQAEYDKAEGDFRRAEELIATGAVARRELDARRAALDVATAALNAAREDIAATRLTAPFGGVVAQRRVELFQNIRANEPVVTLQDLSAMDVLIHVPTRAVLISDGRREAVVTIDGLEGRSFAAALRSFSPSPDPVTQSYAVTLRLAPQRDVLLLPGMAAAVRSADGAESAAKTSMVLAPIAAVAADAAGAPFVWRVESDSGEVRRRAVTLGAPRGDQVEVAAGLAAGDKIVAAGLSHLREGLRVRPWTTSR